MKIRRHPTSSPREGACLAVDLGIPPRNTIESVWECNLDMPSCDAEHTESRTIKRKGGRIVDGRDARSSDP